jgi:predicted dehydrogenase
MPESISAKPRIAVIGLGSMGFGMATSLRRAGFAVTGCDVSADAVKRFVADGGAGARTPAEAAKGADIVVSVVVNAAQTEAILFGKDGVSETLPRTPYSFRPPPWTRTSRGGWRSSWRPRAGIISTRRSQAARSGRRRAN